MAITDQVVRTSPAHDDDGSASTLAEVRRLLEPAQGVRRTNAELLDEIRRLVGADDRRDEIYQKPWG